MDICLAFAQIARAVPSVSRICVAVEADTPEGEILYAFTKSGDKEQNKKLLMHTAQILIGPRTEVNCLPGMIPEV